jgi:pullulanase/glycogen debranching enzyme
MQGGDDPEQRGPMRWDLATDDNEYMIWMRQLIELRDKSRALRIGDFIPLDAQHTVAFIRRTDRVAEAKIIIANPSSEPVEEYLAMRDGKIMDWARLVDHFTGESASVHAGILRVTIPARTVRVFGLQLPEPPNYSPYKRVQ